MKNKLNAIFYPFLILILLLASSSYGKDFRVELKGKIIVFKDSDLKTGKGIEGRIYWKNFYLWGSYDNTYLRLYGQRGGNIDLFGSGVGIKIEPLKNLSLWGGIGYFSPKAELSKITNIFDGGEGVYYVMKEWEQEWGTSRPYDDPLSYSIKGNFGGGIGIDFGKEILKGLFLGFNGGYQFLRLQEYYTHGLKGDQIEGKKDRDFSGCQLGLSLKYQF
jgi:hypothetical protein